VLQNGQRYHEQKAAEQAEKKKNGISAPTKNDHT